MTSQEFDAVLDRRMQVMRSVLGSKAKEYASSRDRLHNFHAASNMLDNTPEQALLGMLAKHLVSVIDLVKTGNPVSQAVADEKIGDSINYLVLLEALMHETRTKRRLVSEEMP